MLGRIHVLGSSKSIELQLMRHALTFATACGLCAVCSALGPAQSTDSSRVLDAIARTMVAERAMDEVEVVIGTLSACGSAMKLVPAECAGTSVTTLGAQRSATSSEAFGRVDGVTIRADYLAYLRQRRSGGGAERVTACGALAGDRVLVLVPGVLREETDGQWRLRVIKLSMPLKAQCSGAASVVDVTAIVHADGHVRVAAIDLVSHYSGLVPGERDGP